MPEVWRRPGVALNCDGCGRPLGEEGILMEEVEEGYWQYTHDTTDCANLAERARRDGSRVRGQGRRGPAPIDYRRLLGGSADDGDDEGSAGR